jgi:hypothetical protein
MNILSPRGLLVVLAGAIFGTGAAIEAGKPGGPPAQAAAGQTVGTAGQAVGFDRYHTPQEVNAALAALNKANPARTALHRIATSPGGLDLLVLEVGPDVGRTSRKTPAVLVVGNLEGVVPVSAEAALWLADRLVSSADAAKGRTWFILPNGNPDAAGRYLRKPLVADERNATRWNDDMDDQTDEDGPDDLDGNGVITEMRVKDPAGEWIPVEGEPRLMRKADASKGEKGVYKLYVEGVDNDGDGEYNEDPPGGTNIGVTFPHLFRAWTATGGRWPGSEPETFAVMKFAVDHPEIAMTFAFGSTNMCLQPPAGGRQASFDANAIKIPEAMASRLGADPGRTYSMKEIIELVQPLAPPGFEITESIVASFLGLGAVVNPLEDDLKFYKELSEKYKELLKTNKLDGKRLDPPQPKDGSFELWSYYHLGVPVFSMDLWTPPEVKAEEQEKSGITPESLESMTSDAFVALGETKIATFLKEVGAPGTIKPQMLIEGVKSGKMTPRQMAGMLKQMPKPKDASGADPKQKALLAFSDKELQGRGYVAWTAFKHPTLGDVEIGGFKPYVVTNPPAAKIAELGAAHANFAVYLSSLFAKLTIAKAEVTALGAGLFRIKADIENSGYLPTALAQGVQSRSVKPVVVQLGVPPESIVTGNQKTTQVSTLAGSGTRQSFEWVIKGTPGSTVTLKALSQKSGTDTVTLTLR